MKSLQTTNASSPSHTFNFIHHSNFNPSSSLSFKTTPKTTALTATAATTTTTTVTQKPKRVFFLDVNPLCYEGTNPSLNSFAKWLSLFLSPQVAHNHPVIAVVDGERGSEHRRKLLPSYKANRRKFTTSGGGSGSAGYVGRFHPVISDVLRKCNVPVSDYFFNYIIVLVHFCGMFFLYTLFLFFLISNMFRETVILVS
jgi:hypothetical protein